MVNEISRHLQVKQKGKHLKESQVRILENVRDYFKPEEVNTSCRF